MPDPWLLLFDFLPIFYFWSWAQGAVSMNLQH